MKQWDIKNNCTVGVFDIFDELPQFMLKADTLFIDPPYNQSLLSNYSYRKGVIKHLNNTVNYDDFKDRLFAQIEKINPDTLFIEIGKEQFNDYYNRCRIMFKNVTFYNSYYLKNTKNKCYIIYATNKKLQKMDLDDKDESDIIKYICENFEYNVIGDLCMGKGLVGKRAFDNNRKFVGIEINEERLIELVNYCEK